MSQLLPDKQSFLETTDSAGTASATTATVTLATAPSKDSGYITWEPTNATRKEVSYWHSRSGAVLNFGSLSTTLTGAATAGSLVVVPVTSAAGLFVNDTIKITDGANTDITYITAINGLNITVRILANSYVSTDTFEHANRGLEGTTAQAHSAGVKAHITDVASWYNRLRDEVEAKAADNVVIKKDGSVAFTADQPMGDNKITGLKTPTVATDAATKAYVDQEAGADIVTYENLDANGDIGTGAAQLVQATDVARLTGAQTIAGLKTFSTIPDIGATAPIADAEAANKKYVDDTAFAGAPNASEVAKGVTELSTNAEQGTSTSLGSTGARLVVPNDQLVKTSSGAGDENKIGILDATGKFATGFLPSTASIGGLVPYMSAGTVAEPDSLVIVDASSGQKYLLAIFVNAGIKCIPMSIENGVMNRIWGNSSSGIVVTTGTTLYGIWYGGTDFFYMGYVDGTAKIAKVTIPTNWNTGSFTIAPQTISGTNMSGVIVGTDGTNFYQMSAGGVATMGRFTLSGSTFTRDTTYGGGGTVTMGASKVINSGGALFGPNIYCTITTDNDVGAFATTDGTQNGKFPFTTATTTNFGDVPDLFFQDGLTGAIYWGKYRLMDAANGNTLDVRPIPTNDLTRFAP